MKRSSVFITVLLSLFMFQSLWNVAAAFCDHESTKLPSKRIISQHFGHHNAPDCTQDQQQHPQLLDIYGIDKPISDQSVSKQLPAHQDVRSNDFLNHINDDHRDHLPSFAHFIVVDNQQHTAQPKFVGYPESIFIGWNNLYQSPDLYLPNPPPLSSPL